jgi:hypothetical protein
MKRYSYFHALILSFFSKSLYQDVARQWRGTGLAYLLLVLALVWIPTVVRGHLGFARFVDNDAKGITEQIPAITITNGEVSTDVPTPYYIKSPKTGATLAVIDTTDNPETSDSSVPVVLTKTKVIMHRGARETRIYDLSGIGKFSADRTTVEGWLATARQWFFPAFYPVAVLASFVFRAIQILIYALIGILFSRLLNANLDYKTLLRLTAVAITPVMILNLLLEFVPLKIPFFLLLGIAIGLGYLFFAVKANSDSQEALPYQPPAPYTSPSG